MKRIFTLKSIKDLSYIIVNDGAICEVSQPFVDMTGYLVEDILNKNIKDLFEILKMGPKINIEDIDRKADYFLFTKSLEVRFVNIEAINVIDKQIYILREKPKSRLEEKFNYFYELCSANIAGMSIYSVPDLILLKANQMYLNFFDNPYNCPENTYSKPIYDFVTGFKGSPAEEMWKAVIESGKPRLFKEFRYDKFARGTTYWDIMMTPIKVDGRFKYIITNTRDVTNRVLHKRELEEKNKMIEQQKRELEAVLDNMADGFYIIDKEGNYIKTNKRIREWVEKLKINNIEDALEKVSYYDLNGKELTKNELPAVRVSKGEKVDMFQLHMKFDENERYMSVSGTPIYDENGNFVIGVINSRDITVKTNQQKLIKEQKEEIEAILDNMQEALLVFDRNKKYIIMNKVARQRFKATFDKIGDTYKIVEFYDIEGNKIPLEDTPSYLVSKGETIKDRILTYKYEESEFYVILSGKPVFDEKGNFLYGIISSRDITEHVKSGKALEIAQAKLLQTEQEKRQALENAMEMKDEFLSIISHEFRTPLNVINTAIQAMNFICGNEFSEKSKEYINIIRQNTFRQLRLVNNLLDITRADAGNIKIHKKNLDIVFLTKSIVDSVYTYASQKGVMLSFVSSVQEKIIGIDDEKYERILLNLLSNAIKFTAEGKSIIVNLSSVNDKVSIQVRDNGIGIPEDKVDVIFERFGQVDSSLSRQAEGAGIGLSLVKKLVEALGGSISVKSKVGKGSSFTILLTNTKVIDEKDESPMGELMDNRLVYVTKVEFSDIYL